MASGKKSFVLYCDQKGIWDKLDNEQAGKLIKHIISYVNDENPAVPDFVTELAFEPIKLQLKRDLKKWQEKSENRSKAGKAGAEARWQNIANDGKRINGMAKIAVNVNDTVNGNVNDNDIYIKTFGSTEEKHFITVVPETAGSIKYRLNGVSGLMQFVLESQGRLPLYTEELGRKFMRNNDGNQFKDYKHVYNTWNLFTKQQ